MRSRWCYLGLDKRGQQSSRVFVVLSQDLEDVELGGDRQCCNLAGHGKVFECLLCWFRKEAEERLGLHIGSGDSGVECPEALYNVG